MEQSLYTKNINLPKISKYFKEDIISSTVQIPSHYPDIDKVLDLIISANVEDIELIETSNATSNEGQHLSGSTLAIKIKVESKIVYSSCSGVYNVHALYSEIMTGMNIVVPNYVKGKDINYLYKMGIIEVAPYVEGALYRSLDEKHIYQCALIFLDVRI